MSGKQIVLVVEDEGIIARDIRASLEKLGYSVPAVVSTGEDAVQKAGEIRPDLVLMDIRLKGETDGIEAADRIRASFDIPVVYLTAHADDDTLQRAKVTEPYGYIMKPFTERDLQTNIEVALYRHEVERKLRLRESRQWLTATLSSIRDAVMATDKEGLVVLMNPVAEELTAWKQEEALVRGLGDIFKITKNETGDPVKGPTTAILQDGADLWLGNDAILIAKDGRETPIDSSAAPIKGNNGDITGVVLVFRDISERKHAEKALWEKEKLFRALIEKSSDAITILNADGTLRYESPSMPRITGYEPGSTIGKTSFELVHPDDMPDVTDSLSELLRHPGGTARLDVRVLHKDGSWRTLEVVATNLLDDPAVAGIVVNQRDITERKQAEEERRMMEQQVQLAGRLAAVGELAAGVAHELNNPLSAAQAYAQLLNDRKDLDETAKNDVETIYREVQRATRITSNLVSFARRHKPEKRVISINETIEKSLELHAYHMKVNNIDLVVELAPDLPMTMADFHQMHQVFLNITNNAQQAMTGAHGKGKLLVKTEHVGEIIRVTFTDDGPGIPAENLNRILDPSFTTKELGEGTGLGLGICFGILREHGANMRAMNNPGKGATFIIELPIVSDGEDDAE